jgi:hypothetical protein
MREGGREGERERGREGGRGLILWAYGEGRTFSRLDMGWE